MGTNEPTGARPAITLDIETLAQISAQLYEQADQVTQVALQDMALNLRLAGRCAELLGKIRFRLGELSEATKDPDTKLELRAILDAASNANPGVGEL